MVWYLPSRKTTAFSHWAARRIDDEMTTSKNSQSSPKTKASDRGCSLADGRGDHERPTTSSTTNARPEM